MLKSSFISVLFFFSSSFGRGQQPKRTLSESMSCSCSPTAKLSDVGNGVREMLVDRCENSSNIDMNVIVNISFRCGVERETASVFSPFQLLAEEVGAGTIPKVVMAVYYTNWAQYRPPGGMYTASMFDPTLANVVNYGFARLNEDLTVSYFDETDIDGYYGDPNNIGAYTIIRKKTKTSNPLTKLLISIGGWNLSRGLGQKTGCRICSPDTKYYFPRVIATSVNRTFFAKSVLSFVRKYKFDGVDLDWEYPTSWSDVSTPADKQNFLLLLKQIRSTFDADSSQTGRQRLLLTVATSANHFLVPKAYDLRQMANVVDWINVMTYDLYGPWEPFARTHTAMNPPLSGNASLFSVKRAIDVYLQGGFPASKIVLGVASYARCFYLADATSSYNVTNLNKPTYFVIDPEKEQHIAPVGDFTKEYGMVGYYEVLAKLKKFNGFTRYDPITQTTIGQWQERRPDGIVSHAWCGYDEVTDLDKKVALVKAKRLRGAFFWAIDLDDFKNGYPLTRRVSKKILF